MLRLRLPGGHITKEKLKFLADKISEHLYPSIRLRNCQQQFQNHKKFIIF